MSAGYAWTLQSVVTLGADAAMDGELWHPLGGPSSWEYRAEWLRLGGTVDVRLRSRLSLQLRAGWSASLHGGLGSYPGFFFGPTVAFRDQRFTSVDGGSMCSTVTPRCVRSTVRPSPLDTT